MTRWITLIFILLGGIVKAQENLGYLLASGIEDTRTFALDYVAPGMEGLVYNRSAGWYHTAESKDPLRFELSVIGNASINLGEFQTFTMRSSDYNNIQFPGGEVQREVASVLGGSSDAHEVLLNYSTTSGNEQLLFVLPGGIAESGVNVIPTYFLQARLGLFRGTEIKARYFPTREFDDVRVDLIGGAVKHEFTSWLPAPELFPVTISGMVTYSAMQSSYDFTDLELLEGANQRLESQVDFWMFSAIVSTNFPSFNLYGGISYIDAASKTDMLGTFTILDNTGATIVSLQDPLRVSHMFTGLKANLGLSWQLGFFGVHAEYNFQKYQTISAGLHFGI